MSNILNAENTDAPLAKQPLLSYQGMTEKPLHGDWAVSGVGGQNRVDLSFGDATCGLLAMGATGNGKSASVSEPTLKRFLDVGCGGLVLTTKDADLGLYQDFPDRVVVIGGSDIARPVNLIGDMSLHTLHAFFDGLRLQLSSAQPYFGSRAVTYAQFVVHTRRLMGLNPTLATVYDVLTEPSWFVEQFDPWISRQTRLPREYRALLNEILHDAFSLLVIGGSKHCPDHMKATEEAAKQYTWHTKHLVPQLEHFACDARLRERLCNEEAPALDMQDLIYRERKVVMTDVPEHIFGPAGRTVNEFLRVSMRNAVLSYGKHREEGYGKDRFTFMVIDEFQHHVSFDQDAASQGLFDDNSWFDRSREYGHINIVAVQGISSLAAKVPPKEPSAALRSLLQNLGTTICFASHDPDTLAHVERHVPGVNKAAVEEILTAHLQRGEAVIVSHLLSNHGGAFAAHIGCGGIHGAPHMAYGLRRDERELPRNRFALPDPVLLDNPLASGRAYHDTWLEWFNGQRTNLKSAIKLVLQGEAIRMRHASDGLNRNTWISNTLDEHGCVQIEFERRDEEAAWGFSMSLDTLFALRDHVENPSLCPRTSDKEVACGWRIARKPSFTSGNWYSLDYHQSARMYIPGCDWHWICEVADQWDALIDEAGSKITSSLSDSSYSATENTAWKQPPE